MGLEPPREAEAVLVDALDAEGERLEALQEEEGAEGVLAAAKVAQALEGGWV